MKKILLCVFIAIFFLIIVVVALFYFSSVPMAVRQAVEKDIFHEEIRRCISSSGIEYNALPVLNSDSSVIYYNSSGDVFCTEGGEASYTGKENQCKKVIFFPIYGK